VLYGRDTECGAIEALLRSARSGSGGTLLMRGEAGVGTSALLEYAAGVAQGMRVLTPRGIEAKTHLAYAGLHELLRPVASGVDRLPPAQARALQAALGLVDGTGPDRFLVSAAVLSLLAQSAESTPSGTYLLLTRRLVRSKATPQA
jgi:hypothetical protein